MTLSTLERTETLKQLQNETLDVLVIGGGITGAGIALQAAASNLKTGLIEMQDFAEGTSSRSTKLVHGGIRYLKTFDVDVVADTVSERARIQKIAPHIPRPSRMLMPLYDDKESTFSPFSAKLAMELYDKLAAVPGDSPYAHKLLSADEVSEYVPNLKQDNLLGLAVYLDYQNNDARLTIENIKQAAADGALALSQAKAMDINETDDGKLVTVQDNITGEMFKIRAKVVVNAGGPWYDKVLRLADTNEQQKIRPTKGVHLVVDASRLSVPETLYFDSGYQDGRMLFVIPREGKTYFGTTDTDFTGDYAHPRVEQADVDYLLKAVNARFTDADLTIDDIQASWAGLRPLIGTGDYNGNTQKKKITDDGLRELQSVLNEYFNAEVERQVVDTTLADLAAGGKSASSVSRGFEIKMSYGMVNVSGGKLTDYRLMGAEAMKLVAQMLTEEFNQPVNLVDSTQYAISGGHFNHLAVDEAMAIYTDMLLDAGVAEKDAKMMANLYGSNVPEVLTYVHSGQQAPGLSLAQTSMLHYAIEAEMVMRPIDFLLRRTNYLLFHAEETNEIEEAVIAEMANVLNWTPDVLAKMTEEYYHLRGEAQLAHLKEG